MVDYSKYAQTHTTPQTQPAPGKAQVANSAGGFVFQLDSWKQLDRFLILGAEGPTYYASERALVTDNVRCLDACLAADGPRMVARIVEVSDAGRAPKNDPAVFALAYAAKRGDQKTREAAYKAVPAVCRIGTHLFQWAHAVNELGGWGAGTRRAVARWYTQRDANALALQLIKYQQRDGWSHRDLLRLAHPKAQAGSQVAGLLAWVAKGAFTEGVEVPAILDAFVHAQAATSEAQIIKLISEHRLPREALPTQWLNSADVWAALLEHMPMTAMIRNLGKMTSVGLLKPLSAAALKVSAQLTDQAVLRKARVHPIAVLAALLTYGAGRGVRGSNTWSPVPTVVAALDAAFYLAFGNIEPSGKAHLLALDVSGSMSGGVVAGIPGLTPAMGAAAMAMIIARTEPNSHIMGFADQFRDLNITPADRLTDVVSKTRAMNFGATDCATPMRHAMQAKWDVDMFVVITDNETWSGSEHPFQALKKYRAARVATARSAVMGMTATSFSIADPSDPGMFDVVGMDVATPQIISDFAAGSCSMRVQSLQDLKAVLDKCGQAYALIEELFTLIETERPGAVQVSLWALEHKRDDLQLIFTPSAFNLPLPAGRTGVCASIGGRWQYAAWPSAAGTQLVRDFLQRVRAAP